MILVVMLEEFKSFFPKAYVKSLSNLINLNWNLLLKRKVKCF